MKKVKEENHKPKKYPISKEFGFYKKYKLPINVTEGFSIIGISEIIPII